MRLICGYICMIKINVCCTQVATPPSFDVAMASVLPLFDAMESGDAPMAVMRKTAVSFLFVLQLLQQSSSWVVISVQYNTVDLQSPHSGNCYCLYIQFSVKMEPSDAAVVYASSCLSAVMGLQTALMAVMRLDVVGVTYTVITQGILWLQYRNSLYSRCRNIFVHRKRTKTLLLFFFQCMGKALYMQEQGNNFCTGGQKEIIIYTGYRYKTSKIG